MTIAVYRARDTKLNRDAASKILPKLLRRIDEALTIARQIAAALEAAHERGIIHRDQRKGLRDRRAEGSTRPV